MTDRNDLTWDEAVVPKQFAEWQVLAAADIRPLPNRFCSMTEMRHFLPLGAQVSEQPKRSLSKIIGTDCSRLVADTLRHDRSHQDLPLVQEGEACPT